MVVITEGWGRWDDGIREYNADERGGRNRGLRGLRGDAQCFVFTIFGKGGKSKVFFSLAVLHPFRVLRWPHPYKWSKISSTHTSIMSQRSRSQMENITKYLNFQNSSWLHRNRESLCVRVTMSH